MQSRACSLTFANVQFSQPESKKDKSQDTMKIQGMGLKKEKLKGSVSNFEGKNSTDFVIIKPLLHVNQTSS